MLDRAGAGLAFAARLMAPDRSLAMEIWTSEPGLQFYDGGYLRPAQPGFDGLSLSPHAGLCLEPGKFPDGPNHPDFPSPVLRPGETYRQLSEFRFAVPAGRTPY